MYTKQERIGVSGLVVEGVGFVLGSVALLFVLLLPVASAAGYLP